MFIMSATALIFATGSGCSGGSGTSQLPTPPSPVTVTASDGSVTLSWDVVAGADLYNVYWKNAPGVTAGDNLIGNVTSPHTHSGLTNGTMYYYAVASVSAGSESALSEEVAATPAKAIPGVPANVSAQAGYESVTVGWDPVDGATGYNLYWSTSPSVTTANATQIANAASPYVHQPLAGGAAYHYVVTAINESGEGMASAEVSATANHPLLKAFVTSASGTGNLGSWPQAGGANGTAAGDAICQKLADDAGLRGTFRAWISSSMDWAFCRVQNLMGTKGTKCGQATLPSSAGPWVRMDGMPFAAELSEMFAPDFKIYTPVRFDENGQAVPPGTTYFTQTNRDGEISAPNPCDNWTDDIGGNATRGNAHATGYIWTEETAQIGCNIALRLLCLQTGQGSPLPAFTSSGSKVFLSSIAYDGNLGGLAGADAKCQALATAAGLTGTFKAWLSSSFVAAKDRVTGSGPWVRVDGVRIADDRADLLDGTLAVPINVNEQGAYVGNELVWTDTQPDGTILPAVSCSDWGNNGAAANGFVGRAASAANHWTSYASRTCDNLLRLYCFED
jgi:hypothetical protein